VERCEGPGEKEEGRRKASDRQVLAVDKRGAGLGWGPGAPGVKGWMREMIASEWVVWALGLRGNKVEGRRGASTQAP
jgi:hypothetical protein